MPVSNNSTVQPKQMTNVQKLNVVGGAGLIIGGLLDLGSNATKQAIEAQRQLAETQRDINLGEIEKAFTANYNNLLDSYIDNRAAVSMEATKAIGQMATATSSMRAIDVSESSFNYEDAKAKVNQEFLENINDLTQMQIQETSNLMAERYSQEMSVNATFSRTSNALSDAYAQSRIAGRNKIIQGASEAASAFASFAGGAQGVAAAKGAM